MTARTVVQSLLGATLAISATLPTTYDAAGYNETHITYTPIGNIEDWGKGGGAKSTVTKFTPCDTGVVTNVKGSKDYGTRSLVIGNVLEGDAGQTLLHTASTDPNHYSVMATFPDGVKHFYDVLVSNFEFADGKVNDVRTINVDLTINRAPVIVAPA